MDKKTIFVVVLMVLVMAIAFFVIQDKTLAPKNIQNIQTQIPGQPAQNAHPGNPAGCVVENCHGLDIKCGANPPELCNDVYELGDRCLPLAKCGVVAGTCQQIPDSRFDACKKCAQNCQDSLAKDPIGQSGCESQCLAGAAFVPSVEAASARKAIDIAYPAFYDFENQKSIAGQSVRSVQDGSDSYFAFIVYGSGLPIIKATCFKVDGALVASKIGEFPNSTTPAGAYAGIDPKTCNGIKTAN